MNVFQKKRGNDLETVTNSAICVVFLSVKQFLLYNDRLRFIIACLLIFLFA